MDLCELPRDWSVPPPKSKPKKAYDKLLVENETDTANKRAIEATTIVFFDDILCINITRTVCYIVIILLETEFMLLLLSIVV